MPFVLQLYVGLLNHKTVTLIVLQLLRKKVNIKRSNHIYLLSVHISHLFTYFLCFPYLIYSKCEIAPLLQSYATDSFLYLICIFSLFKFIFYTLYAPSISKADMNMNMVFLIARTLLFWDFSVRHAVLLPSFLHR